jgi:uncharacterized membrane protein
MVTTYTVLKTIHVLATVTWVGGGIILTTLVARARRATNYAKLASLIQDLEFVGPRIFATSGGILVITGIWMIQNVGLPWDLWIILGLVGWGATFVTGNFFLGPQSKKLDGVLEQTGPEDPQAVALMGRLLNVARVDVVVLTLVIVDMVIKPT